MDLPRPLLVLVDGSHWLHRAFYALPSLTTSRGVPTGAIHGMANMLRRMLTLLRPDYVAVVFDASGPSFRDALDVAYKATRESMPDALGAQIAPVHELVALLGLPLFEEAGVEADDVIATLAVRGAADGMHVLVASGDKDLAQIVGNGIALYDSLNDRVVDAAGVLERYGVPPARIVDYLALIGDKVDNVPGIPGVGPKTAQRWLADYGSLDGVMERAASIGGKVGESLRAGLAQLPLSRTLVTLETNVTLALAPRDLAPRTPDPDALADFCRRYELRSWLGELLAAAGPRTGAGTGEVLPAAPSATPSPAVAPPSSRYETIRDEAALESWIARLHAAPLFAFDTETTTLEYMQAEVVGVSFAVRAGEAAYVPVAHTHPDSGVQLGRDHVFARLGPLLTDPARPKVGHNLKYDCNVLANHGIALRGIAHDTMLASYVLDSTGSRHDMDSLALQHLGVRTIHFEDVAGKGAQQKCFAEVDVAIATAYAAEDADVTLRLHEHFAPRLEAQPTLARLYATVEMPLVPVLSRMERTGVHVDRDLLATQAAELESAIGALAERAWSEAGERFNLGSPRQIQHILFDRLGLPRGSRTRGGQASTAESVLADLAHDHPLPALILEHRALAKLKSTYCDRLPERIDPTTGRVHTNYHQAVAATGRLSSSDPNLQNIPVRTPEGRRIRQAFTAPPGTRLLAADYSQIELRIMAHLSGDANLRAAFACGGDVHRSTAAEVFGVAPTAVSAEQRRAAKAINFGLIYGMSPFGLARNLRIERAAAEAYVQRYFERYPGVREYMERTRTEARERGWVETVFGRRLHLQEIASRNVQRRLYAERTAINAPMQGTAADIIKRAMIEVDAWLAASGLPARMVMQVHDELVFEVQAEAVEALRAGVVERMVAAAELEVALVVDTGVGGDWDEAH